MVTDYDRYGWSVNETNLATLPDSAPEAAKDLTKWLTLEGRRSSLEEWQGCVGPDGRIHGKFFNIGAWTGRMSHSKPNQANIVSPFHDTPKNAVEEIKAKYDHRLRDLWHTDHYLLGTDLDSAQLRVLAHTMKSKQWTEALMKGDKKLGTDLHTLNMKSLGPICRSRDAAKTFVYAWLLGAATPKIAEILECNLKQAKEATDQFVQSYAELKKLKDYKIPQDASNGFFEGLDGRRVKCNSTHLMLAGYLQNGEAVIAKHWTVRWRKKATETGLWFKHVDFVHDEVQVEVKSEEDAKVLLKIQEESMDEVNKDLNLFCPMAIEGTVGKTWGESH